MNTVLSFVADSPRKPCYAILFHPWVVILFLVVFCRLAATEGLPAQSRNGKEIFSVELVSFWTAVFQSHTQTTLGYGDIIPISVSGKTCSIIQAAFGNIYLAFLISVFTSRAVLRSKRLQTYLQAATVTRSPIGRVK